MTQTAPSDAVLKIRKLAQIVAELRQGRDFSITRLTSMKSLCQDPAIAAHFVTFLARKTLERVARGQGRSRHGPAEQARAHRQLMSDALAAMERWLNTPTMAVRQHLEQLLSRMQATQNEYRRIHWGAVRIIHDWDLFLVETAVRCLVYRREAAHWAYQEARDYAERYDSRYPNGLIPKSAPLLQDIVDFWCAYYGIEPEPKSPVSQRKTARPTRDEPSVRSGQRDSAKTNKRQVTFTHRQGQFLAFIHAYSKVHRRAPAELDMVKYFRVTPPSVHSMVVKLHELGMITREPGVARSIRLAVPLEEIPELEDVQGPPL